MYGVRAGAACRAGTPAAAARRPLHVRWRASLGPSAAPPRHCRSHAGACCRPHSEPHPRSGGEAGRGREGAVDGGEGPRSAPPRLPRHPRDRPHWRGRGRRGPGRPPERERGQGRGGVIRRGHAHSGKVKA